MDLAAAAGRCGPAGVASLLAACLLAACGGGSGGSGSGTGGTVPPAGAALQPMASTSAVASSSCAGGAAQVRIGLDANQNGTLDAAEVSHTEVVCVGAGGSLVVPQSEPPGANCAAGGQRVQIGADANGDGALQPGEVQSTQFLCNGTAGPVGPQGPAGGAGPAGPSGATGATGAAGPDGARSLVALVPEPPGPNCATGGTRVTAGVDADRNGTLDPSEVAQTVHVCTGAAGPAGPAGPTGPAGSDGAPGTNGTNGLNSLIATAPEAAGANCADGGTRVQAGLDDDRDGALAAGEVDATSYVCNPRPGLPWVSTSAALAMAPGTGYIATGPNAVELTLPDDPPVGSVVSVTGVGTGGWRLAQRTGQRISTANLPAPARWDGPWTLAPGLPGTERLQIASSHSGQFLVTAPAFPISGFVEVSSDYGETWNSM